MRELSLVILSRKNVADVSNIEINLKAHDAMQ